MNRCLPAPILAAALIAAGACESDPAGPGYDPELPTAWAAFVSNPLFPLVPGTTLRYEGETDEGPEVIVVEVTGDTRMVNGVRATVVRDRVYLDGDLIEDTFDWYAQDAAGNVWYLGEDSREIEDGQVVSTEGSWEWGVDDALPGIIMWADPAVHIGEEYRQEFYEDEAEDWGRVVAVGRTVTVLFGTFSGCVVTEEWNALEPGTLEQKSYCPQLGFVLEVKVEGGDERVELVGSTSGS
jgi:hypothetical protein